MTREPLTDATIKHAKPRPVLYEIPDGQQRGLILAVLPSGLIQFCIRYKRLGKKRRLVLGNYPDLSLAKAREAAAAARVEVAKGHDPAAERQTEKQAPTDAFETLAAQYLEEWAGEHKSEGAAKEDARTLTVDVLKYWRGKSVKSITRADVKDILTRIRRRGSKVQANRCYALLHKLFNFAIAEEWIAFNPAAKIPKTVEEERERVLTHDEIRALWRCLTNLPSTSDKPARGRPRQTVNADGPICPVSAPLADAIKLQFCTATRPGESVRVAWADLELDKEEGGAWWMIPKRKAKNRKVHRVPLSARAEAIVRAQDPDFSINVFAARDGATSKDRLKKAASALRAALGFEFQLKDLRRTASTLMAEFAKVPTEHISRVLNHTVQQGARVTRVYNRYEYDDEKRAAIEAWARVLDAILDNKPFTKIVRFPTIAASA